MLGKGDRADRGQISRGSKDAGFALSTRGHWSRGRACPTSVSQRIALAAGLWIDRKEQKQRRESNAVTSVDMTGRWPGWLCWWWWPVVRHARRKSR